MRFYMGLGEKEKYVNMFLINSSKKVKPGRYHWNPHGFNLYYSPLHWKKWTSYKSESIRKNKTKPVHTVSHTWQQTVQQQSSTPEHHSSSCTKQNTKSLINSGCIFKWKGPDI